MSVTPGDAPSRPAYIRDGSTGLYYRVGGGGGDGGGHAVLDEGAALTARAGLNFVGAGVTATDDAVNDRTIVTIPGGGGGLDQVTADALYVNVTGDSMSGALSVPRIESPVGATSILTSAASGEASPVGTTRTVTVPVGTVAGDVLVLFNLMYSTYNNSDPTTANGFTYIGGYIGHTGLGNGRTRIYTRVADATTPSGATLSFTWPDASGGTLTIIALRGVTLTDATYSLASGSAVAYSSPANGASVGDRLMLSVMTASEYTTAASQSRNTTGETGVTTVADPPTRTGSSMPIIWFAQRSLTEGQTIPVTTWAIDAYAPDWVGVGTLTFRKAASPLVIDTAAAGTTFGGSVTVPTPTAAGHAVTKAYADALGGISQATADTRYINVTGDTMTGSLYVPALEASPATPTAGAFTTVGSFQTYATSRTINVPTGTAAGDLLVLFNSFAERAMPADPTALNGFTFLNYGGAGGSFYSGARIYTRVADASTLSGASLTFTWAGSDGGIVTILRIRNATATSALVQNGGGGVLTSPADAGNTTGQRLLLSFIHGNAFNKSIASNATNTTGETGNVTIADSATGGDMFDLVFHYAYRALADGTGVPATTWTNTAYTFDSSTGTVFSLVIPAAPAPLPIDTAGGGVQFGGPVTVLTPTAAGHAATKAYADAKWGRWAGTQAAYDALGTWDVNTLYVITG